MTLAVDQSSVMLDASGNVVSPDMQSDGNVFKPKRERHGRCCVCEQGLVTESTQLTHELIIQWHNKTCLEAVPSAGEESEEEEKSVPVPPPAPNGEHKLNRRRITLTFTTPWNNRGYDWALEYHSRFTHVAPVERNLLRKSSSRFR